MLGLRGANAVGSVLQNAGDGCRGWVEVWRITHTDVDRVVPEPAEGHALALPLRVPTVSNKKGLARVSQGFFEHNPVNNNVFSR